MKIVGNDIKFLKLSDRDLISNALEQHGTFDNHVLGHAVDILKDVDTGAVLDIGANVGSFTIPMARHKPNMTFVAFEPQRMVYYQLCGNVAINKALNVHAMNHAVGEREGMLLIDAPNYDEETNIGAFSLDNEVREHEDYLCKTKGIKQRVDVITLDAVMIPDVRLIKIDVEGMELAVLKGGVEFLKRNSYPPILFEAWTHKSWFLPRRQELIDFLEQLGYAINSFGEDNVAIHKGV